jgi:hypothetical protein
MNSSIKKYDLEIIAGPCTITPENAKEIIDITSNIKIPDGSRAIYGTRVVGLKSRTALIKTGDGMGIDFEKIMKAFKLGPSKLNEIKLPSVELAERIAEKTNLMIASEIMIPHLQLPFLSSKKSLRGRVMIWNPAVNQLGWNLFEMREFAQKNKWHMGIKHAKFLGKDSLRAANHPDYKNETALEKVLHGLATYANSIENDLYLIHRGVDVPRKGNYRNALTHELMKRVKKKAPKARIFFDPTHSIGPKMRHKIFNETINAMNIKVADQYLYDGLLIESASSSPVDLDEHLTLNELQKLVNKLSTFRKLRSPNEG